MSKSETKKRKKNLFIRGLLPYVLIILIIFSPWLFSPLFSKGESKYFTLETEENGEEKKVIISGLKLEETEEINWEYLEWTDFPFYSNDNKNKFQYRFKNKKLIESSIANINYPNVDYYTLSPLKGDIIKDFKIQFRDFPSITDKKFKQVEYFFPEQLNFFLSSKSKSTIFERIIYWIDKLVNLVILIIIIDRLLGTNILGLAFNFLGFSKSKKKAEISNKKFKDIGGLREAKQELEEIIAYFKNPQEFTSRGINLPKGFLLVGPPGNGKTLLAKALAGECDIPFIFKSGSDFEEVLVGLGASRVRDLFNEARSHPNGCIIFIDEIDSVGRKRYYKNNSNSEQTLNQLLSELDGFKEREKVFVLAATNSLKVLDEALLRPGRFDRKIYISLPNLETRREIIDICRKKVSLEKEVDLEELLYMTDGLSGAQITSVFNEASILSIKKDLKKIDNETIFEAFERVLMGPSSISHSISEKNKMIIAYHEAGHAMVGMSLPETLVKKITIVPRSFSGGYTWTELRGEKDDNRLISKNQMLAQIMTALGGRISEEIIFGDGNVTVGAHDDFKKASEIIRRMIFSYGMSKLGILPIRESYFLGEYDSNEDFPEKKKEEIEKAREEILNSCIKRVRKILTEKKETLHLLAKILIEKNIIYKEEINFIFVNKISPYVKLIAKA